MSTCKVETSSGTVTVNRQVNAAGYVTGRVKELGKTFAAETWHEVEEQIIEGCVVVPPTTPYLKVNADRGGGSEDEWVHYSLSWTPMDVSAKQPAGYYLASRDGGGYWRRYSRLDEVFEVECNPETGDYTSYLPSTPKAKAALEGVAKELEQQATAIGLALSQPPEALTALLQPGLTLRDLHAAGLVLLTQRRIEALASTVGR